MYTDMYIHYPCTFVLLLLSFVSQCQRLDSLAILQHDVLSSHFLILDVEKEVRSKILPNLHLPSKHTHVQLCYDCDSDNDT